MRGYRIACPTHFGIIRAHELRLPLLASAAIAFTVVLVNDYTNFSGEPDEFTTVDSCERCAYDDLRDRAMTL
jgi:hypothetical protein